MPVVLFFLWGVIPILGVLWFLNLVSLIKKAIEHKNTRNQSVLGAVLTFLIFFIFMYFFAGLH